MEHIKSSSGISAQAAERLAVASHSESPDARAARAKGGQKEVQAELKENRFNETVNVMRERVKYSLDRESGKLVIEPASSRQEKNALPDTSQPIDLKDFKTSKKLGALFDSLG